MRELRVAVVVVVVGREERDESRDIRQGEETREGSIRVRKGARHAVGNMAEEWKRERAGGKEEGRSASISSFSSVRTECCSPFSQRFGVAMNPSSCYDLLVRFACRLRL